MSRQSMVASSRQQRGWSQAVLATRCDVSRTEISGIETGRLVPSVLVALRLAEALDVPVESLFGTGARGPAPVPWAWSPSGPETRLWRATLDGTLRVFPVEPTAAGAIAHDSLLTPQGIDIVAPDVRPDRTLVMAGCDPLVGVLVQAMAEQHGVRVLPLLRSSHEALDLLKAGLVHVAGIHLTDRGGRSVNDVAVSSGLGSGYRLMHQLRWQTGIAMAPRRGERSVRAVLNANMRWVNREEGSAARQTLDLLFDRKRRPQGYQRIVRGHRAVAATVSSGWAEAGVCIQPAAAETYLGFLALQEEAYELCTPLALSDDPRVVALDATVRTLRYRQFIAHAPGCRSTDTGEHHEVRAGISPMGGTP